MPTLLCVTWLTTVVTDEKNSNEEHSYKRMVTRTKTSPQEVALRKRQEDSDRERLWSYEAHVDGRLPSKDETLELEVIDDEALTEAVLSRVVERLLKKN
jgi:hypothetical protein